MPDARQTALKALLRVEEGAYSNLLLNNTLKAAGLDRRDEALASALFYGVLERRLTLDAVLAAHSRTKVSKLSPIVRQSLRLGVYQILYMDKIPPSAAVNESVNLVRRSRENKAAGYVNAVLRAVVRAGCALPSVQRGLYEQMSVQYSVPVWLARHMTESYGEPTARAFFDASFGRPPLTVRVNTLKTTPDALREILAEEGVSSAPVPLCPDALTLTDTGSVDGLKAFAQGLFHVQDVASQLCCRALDPQPGDRVLDACAAPGGKTFTMSQRFHNTGHIVAGDRYEARVRLVEEGAQRLGIDIVSARLRDASVPCEDQKMTTFDKILCDVPCSGLGILRKKPEIRYKTVDLLDKLPDLQYRILNYCSDCLKPGGRLVYSTCTLNPAENEAVTERFLQEHNEFLPAEVLPDIERATDQDQPAERGAHRRTLFPHIHHTDGFYIAAFVKKE